MSLSPSVASDKQRVVLIGGGHAHAQVIKALNHRSRPSNMEVTLIDMQKSASYSGMVPGAISKLYSPEDTLLHLEPLCEWAGIRFVHDQVVDVDFDRQCIRVKDSNELIPYDVCSIDIGSGSRGLYETPGAQEFTIPTRPIHELIRRIEVAEDGLEASGAHVVCIGGGAAGIELSMSMTSRWKPLLGGRLDVTLLDAGSRLLPDESPECRAALQNILDDRKIDVKHNCHVQEITRENVVLSTGETIPFTHCIWATGAGSHPLARKLGDRGLAINPRGWIRVNRNLQSISHPNVFAAGDCSAMEVPGRKAPPKAGVYAVRAGPVLIENLTRRLKVMQQASRRHTTFVRGPKLVDYEPQDDFLKLLVCGDGRALGFRFGVPLHGKWVMHLKDHIDQMFMNLFRAEHLPDLSGKEGEYDLSQYDAYKDEMECCRLPASKAAELLRRQDDDVDYMEAWGVLRDMTNNEQYRIDVLMHMGVATPVMAQ
eukprot:CAMPEP_0194040206 /NCGR_PEP_ID=MMETSP0009_2-20130614/12257_1 /TAXON_ID=210454 /ORGANISM="Grammatophora oceanica, Strain CCMP 410" /LENGTH=482 /DNA_ID=CAMNT_0038683285 /DNA_START=212 /DNA_END=1660 /DNA_ORIENTATION=-